MGALQYVDVPGYAAILFRRTYADLALPEALMDRAAEWLGGSDAKWSGQDKRWTFPSGATLSFGYLDTEQHKFRYQSAAFQYVGFDELTQFSETQYRYLFSRIRRLKGVDIPLRMRSASNPGGIGHEWVRQRFVDQDARKTGRVFIPAKLDDLADVIDADAYRENLNELDPVTRAQLLAGDWDVREKGDKFDRDWFEIVERAPEGLTWVRFWDLAATEKTDDNDPDATAGCLLGTNGKGTLYIGDMRRDWAGPGGVKALVKRTAEEDGREVRVRMEQEPGSSGKGEVATYAKELLGYDFKGTPSTGSKEVRANPVSAAAYSRQIKVLRGAWLQPFFDELEAFPEAGHDDQVDALSGAFAELTAPSGDAIAVRQSGRRRRNP